jgi:hypothetical protein
MAGDGSNGNGEGFGQLVELPRDRIAKGEKGKGKKAGEAGNAETLAKRDKPPSAAKVHFQAVRDNEPVIANQIRANAIAAYEKIKGRETYYKREDVIEETLARLAEGESLKSICSEAHMPSRALIYKWAAEDPRFSGIFARAQESQSHALLDDCLQIVDNIDLSDKDPAAASAIVNLAKLQVDTRLRIIGKANPGRYGDKIQHVGANGGPIAVAAVTINARDLMPEQRDNLRQMLLAAKGQQNQELSEDDSEAE